MKTVAAIHVNIDGKDNHIEQKNSQYRNEQQTYLLDQKELSMIQIQKLILVDELLSLNVNQLAAAMNHSPIQKSNRKNSDEDVYVEETLIFTYNPSVAENSSSDSFTSPRKSANLQQTQAASATLAQLIQSLEELRRNLLIEAHKLDEAKDLEEEQRILKLMMEDSYPDAEIDKLLETFSGQIKLNGNNLQGEFIENDIRLSENIRDAIDEIKQMQRAATNKSGEIERRRFLQRYMEIAETLGVSLTVEHLLPALNEIFKQDDGINSDKGYVKQIFQHMEKLIDFLSSSEITVGYNGIRDHIMPLFNDFFLSEKIDESLKQEIQNDVIELLVKVSKIMTNEDRADKILPIILETIRDDSDEEKRILGLELVDKLAEQLGKNNCQNFLVYEIVSLQDDSIYRVRKETVMRMINISKVLGKEIFLSILFPVFKKLANDQIWGVRRSAVEVLPQISNLCPIEIKNGILIEMFKKFSQDSSKWVKMATFQYLGPFIASYEGIEPNPMLIDYYINMCEQNKSSSLDNEVPFHCAFNFPAVLHTLGAKAWPKLQPVHDQLVKDPRWKVRRTLAFSLHEIAKILGPELSEKELIPVLYHFLKDVNEVKEGVTVNLPKFIQVLSPEQRENYVDKFAQTQVDTQDWRKRVVQAKQIRQFSKIFTATTVYKYYVPVFFQLCQDQVAEVRVEASKGVKNITHKLQEDENLFQEFIGKVILFKQSNKFNLRQTFIAMAESLMASKDIFVKYFLKDFCDLQKDRVVNVRMVLSEALANHYNSQPNGGLVQELRELRMMVKCLKFDIRDVADILQDVTITYIDGDEDQQQRIEQQPPATQESIVDSQHLLKESEIQSQDDSSTKITEDATQDQSITQENKTQNINMNVSEIPLQDQEIELDSSISNNKQQEDENVKQQQEENKQENEIINQDLKEQQVQDLQADNENNTNINIIEEKQNDDQTEEQKNQDQSEIQQIQDNKQANGIYESTVKNIIEIDENKVNETEVQLTQQDQQDLNQYFVQETDQTIVDNNGDSQQIQDNTAQVEETSQPNQEE